MTVTCATLFTRGVDTVAGIAYIGYIPKRITDKMTDLNAKLFVTGTQISLWVTTAVTFYLLGWLA